MEGGGGRCIDVLEKLAHSRYTAAMLLGGFVLGASVLALHLGYELPLPASITGYRLPGRRKKRPIRVYMDGCFDMMHYGHCNALRQAQALGDELVVGVVSDAEITENKGPPVTPIKERLIMVGAVKWVVEVIPDAPYAITEEFMHKLFNEYNIDYIIHGDDPCLLPDGSDAYALAKKAGRYKQIKRTEGVSSTDVVGRMLLCVRERSIGDHHAHSSLQRQFSHGHSQRFDDKKSPHGGTRVSHFLPTSRRIVQFSNGKGPCPDARVVYIDGAFDLFHAGHVEMKSHITVFERGDGRLFDERIFIDLDKFCYEYAHSWGGHFNVEDEVIKRARLGTAAIVEILRLAKALGDFLLVGIHTDQTISSTRGAHRPIMNLHERSLSVLACRYVDEVIIGAPWDVSKDMITTFNISLVVHGTIAENMDYLMEKSNPYAVPMELGILQTIKSPLDITTSTIIKRIVSNHEAYQKRNDRKEQSEMKYYESKAYVSED